MTSKTRIYGKIYPTQKKYLFTLAASKPIYLKLFSPTKINKVNALKIDIVGFAPLKGKT